MWYDLPVNKNHVSLIAHTKIKINLPTPTHVTINGTPLTSSLEHAAGSSSSSSSAGSSASGPATAVTLGILASASAHFVAMERASSTDPSLVSTTPSHCRSQHVFPFWMPSVDMSRAAPGPCLETRASAPRSPATALASEPMPPVVCPVSERSSALASSTPRVSPPRPM